MSERAVRGRKQMKTERSRRATMTSDPQRAMREQQAKIEHARRRAGGSASLVRGTQH
jgi:hypothetical protein